MLSRSMTNSNDEGNKTSKNALLPKTLFFTGLAGFSMIFGFGVAVAITKKKDHTAFTKGFVTVNGLEESGGNLAMRALGWGTLWAISGFSAFTFAVWKLAGAKDMRDFRQKVGKVLPKLPKNENPGKTDFKDVQEFIDFILQDEKPPKA